MQCTPQLLRVLKEEIEAIDYGTVKITLNKEGSYFEISSERKKRIIKSPDKVVDEDSFHKG